MSAAPERDESLMSRVTAGDAEAMQVLIRRYGSVLLTFLHRMLADRHRAEELFQETFLAIWQKRGQYDGGRPFKPWMYAIAINRCRAEFRGPRRMMEWTLDGVPLSSRTRALEADSPVSLAVAAENSAMVEAALVRLPPKQRLVVVMRLWSGMSYAQIAQALNVREATARAHMHAALGNLRHDLEPRLTSGD